MIILPDTIHQYAFIAYPDPNDEDIFDHVGTSHVAAVVDGTDLSFVANGVQHDAVNATDPSPLWNPGALFSFLYLFQAQADTTPLTLSFDSGDSIAIGYDEAAEKAVVTVNGIGNDLLAGLWPVSGYGAIGFAVNQTSGHTIIYAQAAGRHEATTILDAPSGTINGVSWGTDMLSVWLAVSDEYWGVGDFYRAYRALRLKVLRRGLSMPHFSTGGAVTHALGMADVRRTLAREIEAMLKAHDSNFRIEERLRREVFEATDKARNDLMGDPVRYCDILHIGGDDSTPDQVDLARGSPGETSYRFLVTLFYGYADADAYTSSSQASLDAVLEDPDTGLLPQLRRLATLDVAGADQDGAGPSNLPPDVADGDMALLGQPERYEVDHMRDSHWARFEISVTTQF